MRSPKVLERYMLKLQRKSVRKKLIRSGILVSNLVVLAVILFFVLNSPKSNGLSLSSLNNSDTTQTAQANPLDQLSSADIALTVAQLSSLPETTAVANQAQSAAADVATAATPGNVVAKPEVVTTQLKSKADIVSYVAQPGDTVSSLATKFGITSDSILWSNGLTSDNLTAGAHLYIPPVNGIVYTVKSGDTAASLATKYKSDQNKIIAYNDAEIGGLVPGERIIIPGAVLASAAPSYSSYGGGFPWGSGPIYGYNGYDYGYCTWYVATQIPVPSNWGNASSWAYYASLSGWNVSIRPTVGAIAQTAAAAGGEGHVAIVNAVSPDGSQIQIRDMNGVAGWGRVGYSGWIPTYTFQHYITP